MPLAEIEVGSQYRKRRAHQQRTENDHVRDGAYDVVFVFLLVLFAHGISPAAVLFL